MKTRNLLDKAAMVLAAACLAVTASCEKDEDIPAVDNSGTGNVNPAIMRTGWTANTYSTNKAC